MLEYEGFALWIANTIQALGGNGSQYLRGLQDEQALTYAATRMVDCQALFCPVFRGAIQVFMPCSVIVPTNKMLIH